ncbi:MAG: carboxymuconolactone decarboxylase family protein [Lachnospiraceae bacterium]|nr:carboxymuconolactone decarboxylase family protein [Lachnospiraceae bacterium]
MFFVVLSSAIFLFIACSHSVININLKLSFRTPQSIITVVALMAQGITDSTIKYHIVNAKNNGVSKDEIAAIQNCNLKSQMIT